MVEKVLR